MVYLDPDLNFPYSELVMEKIISLFARQYNLLEKIQRITSQSLFLNIFHFLSEDFDNLTESFSILDCQYIYISGVLFFSYVMIFLISFLDMEKFWVPGI